MNINSSPTPAHIEMGHSHSSNQTEPQKAPSNTIDFTPPAINNAVTTASSEAPLLANLLKSIQDLIAQFSSNSTQAVQNDETYADSIEGMSLSNMTMKSPPSINNVRLHDVSGSVEKYTYGNDKVIPDKLDENGNVTIENTEALKAVESSNDGNTLKFRLEPGLSDIRRQNPNHPNGPVHARVEAFTKDTWAPEDNKEHKFSGRFNLGDIQNDTSIFQIKQSAAAQPALRVIVIRDQEVDGETIPYQLQLRGNTSDNGKRELLASYDLPLGEDGTPKPFLLVAEDDASDFSFKLIDPDTKENLPLIGEDEKTVVEGQHFMDNDKIAFRWGLYSNIPADQTSTVKISNVGITSKDKDD